MGACGLKVKMMLILFPSPYDAKSLGDRSMEIGAFFGTWEMVPPTLTGPN